MKVLVIHNRYRQRSGEDESTRLEVRALRRGDHEVIEYTRDSREIDPYGFLRRLALAPSVLYSRRSVRDLQSIVQRERPDVAHIHNVWPLISPSAYIALKRLGVPVVQTIRNYRFLSADGLHVPGDRRWERQDPSQTSPPKLKELAVAISWGIHRALRTPTRCIDRYVYLTEDTRELFRRFGFDDKKASVRTNCVDLGALQPADQPDDFVVYLGRLSPEKGVDVLLDAMQLLPAIRLLVVGGGPATDSLRGLCERHGLRNVEFMGHVAGNERFDVLCRARLAVVPSLWREPLSRVVLEAAACGVPVIASRVGGLRHAVREGETGLLVPPADATALASSIEALLADEPRLARMRRAARAHAVAQLGEEAHCKALSEIYSLAISGRSAPKDSSGAIWATAR